MNIHWTKAEVGTTGFTYVLSDTIDSNLDNFFEFCRPSRLEQGQQSFNSKFYMCQSPVFTQGIYKISTKSMLKRKRLPRYKEKIKLLARNKNKQVPQTEHTVLSFLPLAFWCFVFVFTKPQTKFSVPQSTIQGWFQTFKKIYYMENKNK